MHEKGYGFFCNSFLWNFKYKSSSYLLLDICRKSQVNSETSHFAFTLIRCLDINDNCNFKVQCEKKNSSKILSLSSFLKELLLKTTKPYDFEDNDWAKSSYALDALSFKIIFCQFQGKLDWNNRCWNRQCSYWLIELSSKRQQKKNSKSITVQMGQKLLNKLCEKLINFKSLWTFTSLPPLGMQCYNLVLAFG